MGTLIIVLAVLILVIVAVGYIVHEAIEDLRKELRFFKTDSQLKEPIESLTRAIYLLLGSLPKDKK